MLMNPKPYLSSIRLTNESGRATRRELLRGSLAAAGLALGQAPWPMFAFPPPGDEETLIPFLDPQPVNPERAMLRWSALTSWITPSEQLFVVKHYGEPEINPETWRLEITGLVRAPRAFALDEIKTRPRSEDAATIECGGNGVSTAFMGAIGNVKWAGTSLAAVLQEVGLDQRATEVVFYGADEGTETIRGNEYKQNFARSLSVDDALDPRVMLLYELNGKPLTKSHGAPLRLGVPGHFGVAWVKWLTRIEVTDRRFSGRFMARDYVTIRGQEQGDKTVWRETTVSHMKLKSIVARVVRGSDSKLRVSGAAWNDGRTPLKAVEVRIDDGPWQRAVLGEGLESPYCWTFWHYDWPNPAPGEHTLVSRVMDADGNIQPTADDPEIKLKKTYWEANQQVPRRVRI